MIEKLRILLSDKKLITEMGKADRQFIIENYNWEIVAKRFVDVKTNISAIKEISLVFLLVSFLLLQTIDTKFHWQATPETCSTYIDFTTCN